MIYIIETTCETREQAQAIAQKLVESRLVACCQLNDISSYYLWKTALNTEAEVLLRMKTSTKKIEQVVSLLQDIHPYDVPEILVYEAESPGQEYQDWIDEGDDS